MPQAMCFPLASHHPSPFGLIAGKNLTHIRKPRLAEEQRNFPMEVTITSLHHTAKTCKQEAKCTARTPK